MDIVILIKKLCLPNKALEKILLYTEDIRLAAAYDRNLVQLIYNPEIHYIEDLIHDGINIIKILIDDGLIEDLEEDVFECAYSNDSQEIIRYTWNKMYTNIDDFDHSYLINALRYNYEENFYTLLHIYIERGVDLSFIGYEVLMGATEYNNAEIYKILHDNGVNITRHAILHNAYQYKSYDLVDYLETFHQNDGDISFWNKNNIDSMNSIVSLSCIKLPYEIIRKIVLATNDINLICAFSPALAKRIYEPGIHDYMILQNDNIFLLDILLDNYLVDEEHDFSSQSLEYDSVNIYKYLFDEDPDYGQYDPHLRLSIRNNQTKIFEFLFDFYMHNDMSLISIGRCSLKNVTHHDDVDWWKRLYKHGARINQPSILERAKEMESYKLVDYLESLYIFSDYGDSDCEDEDNDSECEECEDDIYYKNGENIEHLLTHKINNANNIILSLKQLKLPHEILEKIIIDTADIYLITTLDLNLVKFMYFPKMCCPMYNSLNNNSRTIKNYIKIQLDDNLLSDIYFITVTMIERNCIKLLKFLLKLLKNLDLYDDYVDGLAVAENNNTEILLLLQN
jgi:hypothetical protein